MRRSRQTTCVRARFSGTLSDRKAGSRPARRAERALAVCGARICRCRKGTHKVMSEGHTFGWHGLAVIRKNAVCERRIRAKGRRIGNQMGWGSSPATSGAWVVARKAGGKEG